MTTPPVSTIFKRFVGSNPIGLAYTGIAALELQIGLASENPVPTPFSGTDIENLRKRLFDEDDPMTGPPTKRIKHHARQPKNKPGEAATATWDHKDEWCGYLRAMRLRLPPIEGGVAARSQRENDIFLKGYKIDFQVHGTHSNPNNPTIPTPNPDGYMGPMVLNWALIQMACSQPLGANALEIEQNERALALDLVAEWWSANEGNVNKSRSFTQLLGTEVAPKSKWQDYWLSGQINPKNKTPFRILDRQHRIFQQIVQNGAGGPGQKNQARVTQYYRIPQHIYLHNNEEAEWENPIYMVYWVSPLNPNYLNSWAAPGQTPARQFDTFARATAYYLDKE